MMMVVVLYDIIQDTIRIHDGSAARRTVDWLVETSKRACG